VIEHVDRFQWREEGAVRDSRAAVSFGCRAIGSIPCTLDQTNRSGRCARAERVEGGQKEAAAS
jgi:hypothetical protein